VALSADQAEALDRAREFRLTRHHLQEAQVDRLARELPLPQLQVPFLFADVIGPTELDQLSDALEAGVAALPDPPPEEDESAGDGADDDGSAREPA
jgi:hypothetical protein